MKKKVAFVIIRYGAEVNGGAEAHCRMLAERLVPYYDVEVLTTTVRVFGSPAEDYPEGVSTDHGVTVRRFRPEPVEGDRHKRIEKRCRTARRIRRYLDRLHLLGAISSFRPEWRLGAGKERRYFESQREHTPAMLRFIEEHRKEYAAFVFLNFYFSQTVLGCTIAPEKTILIPLAHPDRRLYWAINARMFTRVRHIAFNTEAERRTVRRIFGTSLAPNSLLGCGIDASPEAEWGGVKRRYALPDEYVLYLGRITRPKIHDLIPLFLRYKRRYGGRTKLVLTGGADPELADEIASSPEIVATGFVSDAEKAAIVRHATVMVNPSHLESLSLLMLEAMASRVPVLVTGRSKVKADHCRRSGAALAYRGGRDFLRKLRRLLSSPQLRRELGEKGPAYVREQYGWEVIIPKLRRLIDSL